MDQQRAFLEAIQEYPDDDLHRLAWADWLEENGQDDRAAFMRAQLEATRRDATDPPPDEQQDGAHAFVAPPAAEWAGRVAELALEWHWRRGCIEHITARAETLIEHGAGLFASMPIRSVRLLFEDRDVARLRDCPWLRRVESLDLSAICPDSQ